MRSIEFLYKIQNKPEGVKIELLFTILFIPERFEEHARIPKDLFIFPSQ